MQTATCASATEASLRAAATSRGRREAVQGLENRRRRGTQYVPTARDAICGPTLTKRRTRWSRAGATFTEACRHDDGEAKHLIVSRPSSSCAVRGDAGARGASSRRRGLKWAPFSRANARH